MELIRVSGKAITGGVLVILMDNEIDEFTVQVGDDTHIILHEADNEEGWIESDTSVEDLLEARQ